MAQNNSQLERQLRAGIRAARADNHERARELLTGVLRVDRSNELAWIWMAQVVNTKKERRRCLEEVLKINPRNRPARAALNSLVGVVGSEGVSFNVEQVAAAASTQLSSADQNRRASSPRSASSTQTNGGRRISPVLIGLGGVAALLVILLIVTVAPLLTTPPPATETPTPRPVATAISTVVNSLVDAETGLEVTFTPTRTPIIPTPTIGERSTRANNADLQPTFTPTDTPTPTITPTATATLPPLSSYVVYYTAEAGGASALYRTIGSGNQNVQIANNIIEFDISSDGQQVVFTREVAYGAGTAADGSLIDAGTAIELFIAPLTNLESARQITQVRTGTISSPTFIGDQQQVVYASDEDGDSDLYRFDLGSNIIMPLTDNNRQDLDPHWSDAAEQLIFVSDLDRLGNPTLYTYNFFDDEDERIAPLSTGGSPHSDPAWSPDGASVAYSSGRGDVRNIQVVDDTGQAFRSLTTNISEQYAPAWSPDGNYIAYATNVNGIFRIDLITSDGRAVSSISLNNQIINDILVVSN